VASTVTGKGPVDPGLVVTEVLVDPELAVAGVLLDPELAATGVPADPELAVAGVLGVGLAVGVPFSVAVAEGRATALGWTG
jgi:hypothetical protein